MGKAMNEEGLKNKGVVAINKTPAPGLNKTVVVLGTVTDKVRKIQRWFTATDGTIEKYRRGLLVSK